MALRHRIQESVALLILQVAATALHVVPKLVYSAHPTTRIVAYISSLGPIWVLLFGATSLMLGASLWWKGRQDYAHLACATVWVFYMVALFVGAFASSPHGTVFFPAVAAAIVGVHSILAVSYSDDAGVARRALRGEQ